MGDRERIETMVLRQQAVESLPEGGRMITSRPGRFGLASWVVAASHMETTYATGVGRTEADALRALLRDMGVEPWGWPDIEAGIAVIATLGIGGGS